MIARNVDFNNAASGTVESQSGTIRFNAGVSTGGTYLAAANSVIDISGNVIWNGTFTGAGEGRIHSSGNLSSGPDGVTSLNFPDNLFHWVDGVITGEVINQGQLTIDGGAAKQLTSATLTNHGEIFQTSRQIQFRDGII